MQPVQSLHLFRKHFTSKELCIIRSVDPTFFFCKKKKQTFFDIDLFYPNITDRI